MIWYMQKAKAQKKGLDNLGPVVQSTVSLTSLLMTNSLTVLRSLLMTNSLLVVAKVFSATLIFLLQKCE